MIRRILCLTLCIAVLAAASLAFAGGPAYGPRPYAKQCAPGYGGNPCAFWGDAPFPGLCGGIVGLPFLVVGTLLGGNPVGPCGPPPNLKYGCAPGPYPPRRYGMPPRYGAGYAPNPMMRSVLGGLPPVELATGLISGITGGGGLL
jgi:hypothetical protein